MFGSVFDSRVLSFSFLAYSWAFSAGTFGTRDAREQGIRHYISRRFLLLFSFSFASFI